MNAWASLTPFLLLLRHLQKSQKLPISRRPSEDLIQHVWLQVEEHALLHLPTLLSSVAQEVQEIQIPSPLPESLWLPARQTQKSD
jgi:hypothetical protein